MRLSLLALAFALPTLAYAQDDEDDFTDDEEAVDPDAFDDDFEDFEDDEDAPEEYERIEDGDYLEESDEIEDEDWVDDPDADPLDFDDELEELGDDEVGGEGVDNVAIYREYIDNMNDLPAEEELIAWERYLTKYPNTLFRDRIDARMEEITDDLYGDRIDDGNSGYVDAKDRELELAHPMMLENADPRTRARVGFEVGFPSYIAGYADFEYQILRPLSVHAGFRNRYTGRNLEVGAKYAVVKSARTNTLVTGMLDLRYNLDPAYPALRPQVAVGHRFDLGGGLDVLAQGGVDMELSRPVFSMRYVGGAHIYYQASEVVGVFAEGSINIKSSGTDGLENFQFNVFTFGLKYVPGKQPAKIGLAADVPVAYNYWGYHVGAVQADFLYYMDDLGK